MINWDKIAEEYWADQPHPLAPSLRVGDFATAVKLATKVKFGGHATAKEAEMFWPGFVASGITPENFLHAVDRLAPLSFTYHGRPPSMQEIVQLNEKSPKEARSYFADLPDKNYPHVSAGDMVKTLQSAEPHAMRHLKRVPNKVEAAYLHHSGERPADYYQRLAEERDQSGDGQATLPQQQNNVVPIAQRRQPGNGSLAPAGRPQAGQ